MGENVAPAAAVEVGQVSKLRPLYAEKALSQLPRLLSLQDRVPFSRTYGCFDRTYWLDKAIDFPSALAQFSVHSLALSYCHPFPGSSYYQHPKLLEWALAGMDFWTKTQHPDGSFDEFYPYERGWAGPTAFTLYAMLDSLRLLGDQTPAALGERVRAGCRKAALYISRYTQRGGVLANHHAVAVLAVRAAYELFGGDDLLRGYEKTWRGFLQQHNREEGWSLEYDGPDPGYLSATVSFLAKTYQMHADPELFEVLKGAIEFSSYFVYPDKHYAGSLGSRQTLHFYPHGFEIMAPRLPLAAAVAEKALEGLQQGALVTPEIMPDRYLCYRVSEYLQAYLDCGPRPDPLPPLPYEREPFRRYFPAAKIYVAQSAGSYLVANLGKGGVVKLFDRIQGRLLYNDGGLLLRLSDGTVATTQWTDASYRIDVSDEALRVQGRANKVPSEKQFTPFKMALFRLALLPLRFSTRGSHLMKSSIRKVLMLGSRPTPVEFERSIVLNGQSVTVRDQLRLRGSIRIEGALFGDEFAVRYVPQSRYFQPQELESSGLLLDAALLQRLNSARELEVTRQVDTRTGSVRLAIDGAAIERRVESSQQSASSSRQ